ncbi:MAG: hypothetical protein AVDCRST_MAG37-2676 [uncultured Rubrobacteraceae bacterium]|uniref:Uncharacterized protein n=1 Tax=uncultured Rubrobacteraceae bacterium TaxID=349277 RepID=A0A6J4QVX8_9ACTN|nr:MAG: hypothetical protein AVDCRST_MAG37-2676 [uncultured Rubrobacteraceae bacterium]
MACWRSFYLSWLVILERPDLNTITVTGSLAGRALEALAESE